MRRAWVWIGVLVLVLSGELSRWRSVDRSELGIAADEETRCFSTGIVALPTFYEVGNHDSEQIAFLYLPLAIAALEAYPYVDYDGTRYESEGDATGFLLGEFDDSWVRQGRVEKPGGLALDVYFNHVDPKQLLVLVAFRGTEISWADWLANLSWIAQVVPIADQYDRAREAMIEIRRRAREVAHGKSLTYLTTGHSLGGGLAIHVASAFPCTSAVVFDTSFVLNRHRLAEPYENAEVVHVYDRDDELTWLKRQLFRDAETPIWRNFGINLVPIDTLQHRSLPLAVGMARMVATCQKDGHVGCPQDDLRARRLYCRTTYATGERDEAHCRF